MKKIYIFAFAALMALSCGKEPAGKPSGEEQLPAEVEVKAELQSLGGVDSKVSMAPDSKGGFQLGWTDTDVLTINGKTFSMLSHEGRKAVFKGPRLSGGPYEIIVGSSESSAVQNGSGGISHLAFGASLKGVDDYEDISFGYDWAAAHGGKFIRNTILRLEISLPLTVGNIADITVSGTGLSAPVTLTVTSGAIPKSGVFTAYLPLSSGLTFDTEGTLTVKVNDSIGNEFEKTFKPGPQTYPEGYVTTMKLAPSDWSVVLGGPGSEKDPYAIRTLTDLSGMKALLQKGAVVHFRLMEDIDMSSLSSWEPLCGDGEEKGVCFDGNNHTLSGFTCKASDMASFFGMLSGTVKNLTFANPKVTSSSQTLCGIVAAKSGDSSTGAGATLENVKVTGGLMSCSGTTNFFGGLVGEACNSVLKGCSFDGTVERTSAIAQSSTYYPVGGLIGKMLENVVLEGCSTSGKLTTNGGRACGGLVGLCSVEMSIKDCSSTMDITARHDVAGGMVGYGGSGSVSGCSYSGSIVVRENGTGTSYVGGIVGHAAYDLTISRCSFSGSLEAPKGIVAGILGQSNSSQANGAVISECRSSGTIKGSTIVGGIVGRATNSGLKVENCYSTADIICAGSYAGGVAGDLPKNASVKNCFATGKVEGTYALGGVVGRAYGRQGSSDSPSTDVNTSVTGCIAWNTSIKTKTSGGENPASHYGGATVVGFNSYYNTLSNNWRSPSIDFFFYSVAVLNTPYDQEDSGPGKALVRNYDYKWYSPCHGKAAAAGEKLTAVASRAGFSTSVWDLSGDVPELKCFK
ncbi:MAG: hypothetical protein IJM35_02255 [Bacteroidales bacterium]|nr:hypothetical protein [Bacteroidales bacterium]